MTQLNTTFHLWVKQLAMCPYGCSEKVNLIHLVSIHQIQLINHTLKATGRQVRQLMKCGYHDFIPQHHHHHHKDVWNYLPQHHHHHHKDVWNYYKLKLYTTPNLNLRHIHNRKDSNLILQSCMQKLKNF